MIYEIYASAEKQEQIPEILRKDLTIRGSRLSELLGVSEMTIRRDLNILEKTGVVERTHGGAIFRPERLIGKFHYRISTKEKPREWIGHCDLPFDSFNLVI